MILKVMSWAIRKSIFFDPETILLGIFFQGHSEEEKSKLTTTYSSQCCPIKYSDDVNNLYLHY